MSENRILLVDDDIDLSRVLKDFLLAKGFEVDDFSTVEDAWDNVLNSSYDLIILDWDLPGASGVEFCRFYRNSGGLAPVLMMTGRKELDDKETGLEAGADDYVTKPFALRELHARVKSMLRRTSTYLPPQLLGSFEAKAGVLVAGKYRLEEPIGKGGMALVWKATDIQMERIVVVKLMHGSLVGDGETSKRFEYECKMLAKVKHPNVVSIYDAGSINAKVPYLVMEYVNGESLRQILVASTSLPVETSVSLMIEICTGMQEIHDVGIIHRDLKPDNILVQRKNGNIDAVKIADFGIARLRDGRQARLTQEGMVVGTLEYISPEQLQDLPLDGRADIYALGIILFELLTGELPLNSSTADGLVSKHLIGIPTLPSEKCDKIPEGSALDLIVEKCLQKDPVNRFQSVSELRDELKKLAF